MTREQYIRSNKVGYPLIMLTCTIIIMTLLGALEQGSNNGNILRQIIGIVVAMVLSTTSFLTKRDQKIGMICCGQAFL